MRRVLAAAVVSVAALALSGCEVGSGTLSGSPGVQYPPFGLSGGVIGSVTGNLTGSGYMVPGACAGSTSLGLTGSVTFTGLNGSVTENECWALNTSNSVTAQFTGQYTVVGGTGALQGATGTGTSILTLTSPTVTLIEFGTFNVPGTASAAPTPMKRTFKMPLKALTITKWCSRGSRQCTIKHRDRVVARLLDQIKRH